MKRVLDDLSIFCAVAEVGSLKKAAERMSLPHSTVSRRMDALESNLGLTLLHRTTREVKVSAQGQELYQDCSPLLTSIQRTIDLAIDSEVEFKGKLKVSMPVRAGIDFLGGWLIDFASEHSELTLDVSLSNSNKNLIQDEIDLAFRVGPLVDSSAIALKLWDIPYSLCATKTYLDRYGIQGSAITVEQLESLPCVISRPSHSWTFINGQNQEVVVSPNQDLVVDDLGLSYHSVLSNAYLAMLPSSMIRDEEIIELNIEGLMPRSRIMYAYYLGRRHAQSQIRHIVDYIKKRNTEFNR